MVLLQLHVHSLKEDSTSGVMDLKEMKLFMKTNI